MTRDATNLSKDVYLNGAKILVAEDEPYVALDLANAIEQSGAVVVGPFSTVAATLECLKRTRVDAAILDFRLADGTIEEVLAVLKHLDVKTLVQTGAEFPPELAAAYPEIIVYTKPSPMLRVWDRLVSMLGK